MNISAGTFTLAAYLPPNAQGAGPLAIYIEGDGLAYLGERTVSADPTPDDPLALRLALAHPGGKAAYLARPCQFVASPQCRPYYWTYGRFAEEVVDSTNRAVEQLKRRTGSTALILVGYSGGANLAALVAARRTDVVGLVSVAGNLDHRLWTAMDDLTPLDGSLSAMDVADRLADLPQAHFAGSDDSVVAATIPRSFVQRLHAPWKDSLTVVKGFDHACCWADQWRRLASTHPSFRRIPAWPLNIGAN